MCFSFILARTFLLCNKREGGGLVVASDKSQLTVNNGDKTKLAQSLKLLRTTNLNCTLPSCSMAWGVCDPNLYYGKAGKTTALPSG